MPDVDPLAVLVATVVAIVLSSTYYIAVGDQLATVSAAAAEGVAASPWTIAVELLRSLVVVAVVAGLASQTGTDAWTGGMLLGLALWVGFPLVLWAGAVLHERTPWKLAAIHAGRLADQAAGRQRHRQRLAVTGPAGTGPSRQRSRRPVLGAISGFFALSDDAEDG